MRADNTRHVVDAARRRAERTRRQALEALQRMTAAGMPITFEALAREAHISRSWLYTQSDLRTEIDRLRRRHSHGSTVVPPERQRASDASLLRRLEAATARIRHLEQVNRELRAALELALGAVRTDQIAGCPTRGDTPGRPDTPQERQSPNADHRRS